MVGVTLTDHLLQLGAGCGLVGLTVAALGGEIVITDRTPREHSNLPAARWLLDGCSMAAAQVTADMAQFGGCTWGGGGSIAVVPMGGKEWKVLCQVDRK